MTLTLVLVGVAVFFSAEALYYLVRYLGEARRSELRRRLQAVSRSSGSHISRERRIARNPTLERLLAPLSMAQQVESVLLQTDLSWTVATVIGLSAAAATALTAGLMYLLPGSQMLALVGIPLGMALPPLFVFSARAQRSTKISEQLPDALEMMVRSLRAGHGTAEGLRLVAGEMPPPVAVEFGRTYDEQRVGVDLREAVTNMCERVPGNLDLRLLAVSLVIQHETGGNLVEILDQIANTVRERHRFYGKLKSLTAEGKLSGIILGALPFICGLFVSLTNPKYLRPLIDDRLGNLIGLAGIVMWLLGVVWMKRLARVDY